MVIWLLALIATVHVCGSDISSKDFYSIIYEESSLMTSNKMAAGGMFWLRNEWNASLGIPAMFPNARGDYYMLQPGESARYVCMGTGEWMLYM